MNRILDFMGEDHDRLDGIFKEFQGKKSSDYSKAKVLFSEFKTGLQRHIVWEEEILFPLFENRTGMHNSGPTAVMRMEQRQIKEFLEKIHDKILKKDTKTNDLERGLIEVLTAHNGKEENILYPWIDNTLNEKERKEAFTKMKTLSAERYNKCC
jgi:regulator of cell morphogenesis and NO signaling